MTYIPTNWQTGDIVTADKLNKIESGIEECSSNIPSVSGLVEASIDAETNALTINKSFSDLFAIMRAGILPFLAIFEGSGVSSGALVSLMYEDGVFVAHFTRDPSSVIRFFSSDSNSFMTTEDPGGGSTPK